MLTANNILSLQNNMAKDIKQNLAIKNKIRMNSEERLMAKKIEQANNAAMFTKTLGNKYVRVGSGGERKRSIKKGVGKNISKLLKSNASGSSNNDQEKSNDTYRHLVKKKKFSVKKNQPRVGSPEVEMNEGVKDSDENKSYFEKQKTSSMPKKKLRLNSDNNRNQLNQYPFPLTPIDKAVNKQIDIGDTIIGAKSHSTRNK